MRIFDEMGLQQDPIKSFSSWLAQAEAAGIAQSEAVSLATVNEAGIPSLRTVLFKGLSGGGFRFFTNYQSLKSKDIELNANAALLFFWQSQARQIRITGSVSKLSVEESHAYFASRDRGSQIGAWASEQSAIIASREVLLDRVEHFEAKFPDAEVPCPPNWGGFKVMPVCMEFWQGRDDRLHDRLVYTLSDGEWRCDRLAP